MTRIRYLFLSSKSLIDLMGFQYVDSSSPVLKSSPDRRKFRTPKKKKRYGGTILLQKRVHVRIIKGNMKTYV